MFFFWLFQIASLLFLSVSRYFFDAPIDSDILILSLLILFFAPVIIPIVGIIREDMTPMHSIFTRAGVFGLIGIILFLLIVFFGFQVSFGTIIFIGLSFFAVYFRIESRLFSLVALLGLIVTVSALMIEKSVLAESSSVLVYLALVIGVFVEIGSPWFDRFHSGDTSLIHITPEFRIGYQEALADYAWMMTIGIQTLFVVALIGRGIVWNYDYQMLLYFAFGVWIFFSLYLICYRRALSLQDFVVGRFSKRYILSFFRDKGKYIPYFVIWFSIVLMILIIDWTLIWKLPSLTLISLITLVCLIIVISVYSIVSIFYRR